MKEFTSKAKAIAYLELKYSCKIIQEGKYLIAKDGSKELEKVIFK